MEEPRVLSTNQWPSDLGWSEGYSRKGVGPTLELGVVVEVLHQHLQTIGMLVLSVPIQYIHLSSHERSEISDFSANIMHGREEEHAARQTKQRHGRTSAIKSLYLFTKGPNFSS